MKTKAVFLDRDGVLNKLIIREGIGRAPYQITDLELIEGVTEAIKLIKSSGFLAIVVTNQPDVVRGWVSKESVEIINLKISELLPIDEIKVCYHVEKDQCLCRKPAPGMLIEAAQKWRIDLEKSFMVGDRFSDIKAGADAGCKTILVGPGDDKKNYPDPTIQVQSLKEAVEWVIDQGN